MPKGKKAAKKAVKEPAVKKEEPSVENEKIPARKVVKFR